MQQFHPTTSTLPWFPDPLPNVLPTSEMVKGTTPTESKGEDNQIFFDFPSSLVATLPNARFPIAITR